MSKTLLACLFFAAVIAAGCGSSAPEAPTTEPAKQTTTAPETETKPEAAKEGFSNVFVTDQKEGTEAKTAFTKDLDTLYAYFDFNLPQGSKIKGAFVCDKSSMTGAEGTIKEATLDVNGPGDTGNFSMTRPKVGWPSGEYHFELYVNDELKEKVPFTVE